MLARNLESNLCQALGGKLGYQIGLAWLGSGLTGKGGRWTRLLSRVGWGGGGGGRGGVDGQGLLCGVGLVDWRGKLIQGWRMGNKIQVLHVGHCYV